MDPGSSQVQTASVNATGLIDVEATFERLKSLLKAKDDTSRFVGLALLKTILDNGELARDSERLGVLWESISPKFLDRLLKAQQNEKISNEEARNMVDLAVAVLHTFTALLPEKSRVDKRLIGRTATLVKALTHSPSETIELILQTLLTTASRSEGALEVLKLEDSSPFIEIATTYPIVLQILSFSWINAAAVPNTAEAVQKCINQLMPQLLVVFQDTDAVTLIDCIGDTLPKLVPEAIPSNPVWLAELVQVLRKLISSKPTLAGRIAYTKLASALLQVYSETTPYLLFKDGTTGKTENKPFCYLLINLLLIDLRSSFPALLIKLNSEGYPAISQRLAAAFDIISSFIGFLVRSLDDNVSLSPDLSMPPDLLLKLRKDIAETMSLTIEYLRDRWDASIAGASGLHPSARTGTAATSAGTRLTLPWGSMKDQVNEDSLILAGIRGLAIWIREDENENLRRETAGLMDMFIELYKSSSEGGLDFRYPILLGLEGIMDTEEGVEGFLAQSGWQIVFNDVKSILRTVTDLTLAASWSITSEAARGTQIIRVLLAVLDHPSTSFPQEEWMTAITSVTSIKVPSTTSTSVVLEFLIATVQLATALLSKASGGMSKRYITSKAPLSGLTEQLKKLTKKIEDGTEVEELVGLLDDVLLDLENLDVGR